MLGRQVDDRNVRLAVLALSLDALLVVGGLAAGRGSVGLRLRIVTPLLAGECLTWSFWAPLILFFASIVSVVLAYRAPWYEAPRGSHVRQLVRVARFVSVVSTIGWGLLVLTAAYLDPITCQT